MSYDVKFFKLPPDQAVDIDQLGEEEEEGESAYREQLEPLGTPDEIEAVLKGIFPNAEFERFDSYREGYLFTGDYAVTFFILEKAEVRILELLISGTEAAFAIIQTLHDRTGWRAADEAEIDFDGDPASGLRYWTGTLDTIRQHAGTTKKWWQFWK